MYQRRGKGACAGGWREVQREVLRAAPKAASKVKCNGRGVEFSNPRERLKRGHGQHYALRLDGQASADALHVTFDQEICARFDDLVSKLHHQILAADWCIMRVKEAGAVPYLFTDHLTKLWFAPHSFAPVDERGKRSAPSPPTQMLPPYPWQCILCHE